jgi:UTP--glucose-1-phosphate uridylyltransferase
MVEAYNKVGGNIIAVEPTDTPERYGVITPESRDGRLIKMKGMVEKPKREDAPSNLFISGRYILQPEIFELLESQGPALATRSSSRIRWCGLMSSQSFHALEYEGTTYDCGDKVGYMRATAAYALANAEHGDAVASMLQGLLADRGK